MAKESIIQCVLFFGFSSPLESEELSRCRRSMKDETEKKKLYKKERERGEKDTARNYSCKPGRAKINGVRGPLNGAIYSSEPT